MSLADTFGLSSDSLFQVVDDVTLIPPWIQGCPPNWGKQAQQRSATLASLVLNKDANVLSTMWGFATVPLGRQILLLTLQTVLTSLLQTDRITAKFDRFFCHGLPPFTVHCSRA